MINNQKMFHILHVTMDICTIIVAYFLAYYIRFNTLFTIGEQEYYFPLGHYSGLLLYLVPIFLLIYYGFHLYKPELGRRKWFGIVKVALSNILGIIIFFGLLYLIKETDISRMFIGIFAVINIILCAGSRILLFHILNRVPK